MAGPVLSFRGAFNKALAGTQVNFRAFVPPLSGWGKCISQRPNTLGIVFFRKKKSHHRLWSLNEGLMGKKCVFSVFLTLCKIFDISIMTMTNALRNEECPNKRQCTWTWRWRICFARKKKFRIGSLAPSLLDRLRTHFRSAEVVSGFSATTSKVLPWDMSVEEGRRCATGDAWLRLRRSYYLQFGVNIVFIMIMM